MQSIIEEEIMFTFLVNFFPEYPVNGLLIFLRSVYQILQSPQMIRVNLRAQLEAQGQNRNQENPIGQAGNLQKIRRNQIHQQKEKLK